MDEAIKNVIKVNMLGAFEMFDPNGKQVITDCNNRSKKVLTLLEYLLAHRSRAVLQDELIELLWPEDDSDRPSNTLKTLLHRVRTALEDIDGENLILCRRGVYSWNNTREMVVDAEEFEKACKNAESLTDEERLPELLRALELYRGDFLAGASGELWVSSLADYYHGLYLKAVFEAVELLNREERTDEVIDVCRKAVTIDQLEEPLHLALLRAMIKKGLSIEAINYYNQINELFMDKFGVTPSEEFTSLYKELVRTIHVPEQNLNIILNELRETERISGAFCCEYAFFKDMYRREARAAIRNGAAVQIALLSVSGNVSQKHLAIIMQRLKEVILKSLRCSDVFSRYSVTQYILMFSNARVEDSQHILERIKGNFHRTYPHMNVTFHSSSLPMEPVIA